MCVICAATQTFDPSRHYAGDGHNHNYSYGASNGFLGFNTPMPEPAVTVGTSWGSTPTILGDAGGVVTWSLGPSGQSLNLFPDTLGSSVNPSYFFDHVSLIREAFQDWSDVANIEFMQVEDPGGAPGATQESDIRMFFGNITGGTIGWAYFPTSFPSGTAGDILLDSVLPSFFNQNGFKALALHEIGHAIGLDHNPGPQIMNPSLGNSLFTLQPDDINGARQIYGAQDSATPVYTMKNGQSDLNILNAPTDIKVNGNSLGNEIDGTDTDQTLNGKGGDDDLIARGGQDTMRGGGGDDTLRGGNDSDRMNGGNHDDILYGGSNDGTKTEILNGDNGNDTLFGEGGDDRLDGGSGNDSLDGGSGNDTLFGRDGNDVLVGGQNDDRLTGGNNNDLLQGDGGRDRLFGEAGSDTLEGGTGNDFLDAGAGSDTLEGGAGNDRMIGGSNTDTFVFGDNHGADRIDDFNANNAGEKIDLSQVSTLTSVADLMLSDPNAGAAQQVGLNVVITTSAGNSITLNNTDIANLDTTDFIF